MVYNRGKVQRNHAAVKPACRVKGICCLFALISPEIALNLSSILDHPADLNPLSVKFPLACTSKHISTGFFLSTSVHWYTSFPSFFDAQSTFYCNEGVHIFWMENGEKKLLPKSKGQSIMISGFMCACHGFMSAEIDSITYKSHQYFQAGSGCAFTNAHINEQFRNRLILVFWYLKYHCELNYIEMVWGWIKAHHRNNCKYNYPALKKDYRSRLMN